MNDESHDLMVESEMTSVQEPMVRWVTFQLADETYGIDVMKVREVLRVTEIAPVPGADDYVLGIINLRGNVVTVADGRKRLNLPPHEVDDATRIVIVEMDDQVLGVVVDSVTDVVDLPLSAINSKSYASGKERSEYIEGIASHDDGLIIMINLEKLFTQPQWNTAAGF